MSSAAEIYTITAALERAEIDMNLKKEWISNKEEQKRFLNYMKECRGSKISEIDVEVSSSSDIINNFLEKKGFSIRLQPFPPNTLGFAGILDLLVEWLYIGEKIKIKAKNANDLYEGVRIKKDGVSFFKSMVNGYSYAIAGLYTKSGDMIYMTVPKNPIVGLDLIEIVDSISNNMEVSPGVYDGIRFPMVDLDLINNLEWLKGMSNIGKIPVEITQAVQQIKIKMNEKGARFKSGTAIAVTLTAVMTSKPDMVIDEPFLLWVEKHDLKKPLMAAFITEDSWKNPENL